MEGEVQESFMAFMLNKAENMVDEWVNEWDDSLVGSGIELTEEDLDHADSAVTEVAKMILDGLE